jgi:hypothetical protein
VQYVVAFPSAKPKFTRRRFIEGGLARHPQNLPSGGFSN